MCGAKPRARSPRRPAGGVGGQEEPTEGQEVQRAKATSKASNRATEHEYT
jgi:hypothetical protein